MHQNGDDRSSLSRIKSARRLLIFTVTIAVAIVAAFGVVKLFKYLRNNADIKIGETTITKSDTDNLKASLEKSMKENPELDYLDGKSIDDVVKDRLILNALLKKYNKECNVNADYSEGAIKKFASISDELFESSYRGNINTLIFYENEILKEALKDCLIFDKKALVIQSVYYGPYYSQLSSEEKKESYGKVKEKLSKTFRPLLVKGASASEIAKLADLDFVNNEHPNPDVNFSTGPVFVAKVESINEENVLSNPSAIPEELKGEAISATSYVKSLTKKGQTSDVKVLDNGRISVARVESVSGRYASYEDMLDVSKKELGVGVISAIKSSAIAIEPGVSVTYGGKDALCRNNHFVEFPFRVQLEGGASLPEAVSIHSSQTWMTTNPGTSGYMKDHPSCLIDTSHSGTRHIKAYADCNSWIGNITINYNTSKYDIVSGRPLNYGGDFTWDNYLRIASYYGYYSGINGGKVSEKTITFRLKNKGTNPKPGGTPESTPRNPDPEPEPTPPSPPPSIHDTLSHSASATTEIKNAKDSSWRSGTITIKSGETVHFKHKIDGSFSSRWSDYSMRWSQSNTAISSRNVGKNNIFLGTQSSGNIVTQGDTSPRKNSVDVIAYRVTDADMGKTICESINYTYSVSYYYKQGVVENNQPTHRLARDYSRDISRSGSSSPSCFYVPYNYKLTPCVESGSAKCGGSDIPVEPGEDPNIIPHITGAETPISPKTRYIVTRWEIPQSNEDIPTPNKGSSENSDRTCEIYRGLFEGITLPNCNTPENSTIVDGKKKTFEDPIPEIPEDAPVGSRFCAALSISPASMSENEDKATQENKIEWKHSTPVCVIIVKKPSMAIWNSGIFSRGGIKTIRSNFKGAIFGSWVEYEAISNGRISGLGSGSSRTGSSLTFSNNNETQLGGFGRTKTGINSVIRSAIESRFPRSTPDAGEGANIRVQNFTGNSELDKYEIPLATSTRVVYGDRIHIKGDQTLSKIGQQLVIVANGVFIDPKVEQIDAIIIADTVVTCADGYSDNVNYVTHQNCNTPLTVNGSILSNTLKSYRTAGDHKTGEPAETYNQRPDMYFWAQSLKNGRPYPITTYTKELPVRY